MPDATAPSPEPTKKRWFRKLLRGGGERFANWREQRRELSRAESLGYRKARGEQKAEVSAEGARREAGYHAQRRAEEGRWTYGLRRGKRFTGRFLSNASKTIIVIAAIILIYMAFTSDAQSAIWVRTQTGINKLEPAIGALKVRYNPVTAFNKYVLGIQTFESPDKAPETVVATVHLRDVHSIAKTIYEKDKIILIGAAEIDPLNLDSAKIRFDCNMERPGSKQDREVYIVGKTKGSEDANVIEVKKNQKKKTSFVCELPAIEAVQGKEFDTYSIDVSWTFAEFTTATDLDFIALNREKKEEAESASRDPIMEFRNSNIIDKDGYARDVCVKNCYLSEVGISINTEMPLVENTEYLVELALVNLFERGTRGKVKNLTSLTLLLPQDQGVEGSCPQFGNDLTLDKTDKEFPAMLSEDKVKENMLRYYCNMRITSAEDFPTVKKIRAVAVYEYGDTIKVPIVVEKRPESLPPPAEPKPPEVAP